MSKSERNSYDLKARINSGEFREALPLPEESVAVEIRKLLRDRKRIVYLADDETQARDLALFIDNMADVRTKTASSQGKWYLVVEDTSKGD